MIFIENRQTSKGAMEAKFCRTELLWTPFERIFSILSCFQTYEHAGGICTHQARQIDDDKNLFSHLSTWQTTTNIVHKIVSEHTEFISSKSPEKVGFRKEKYVRIRRAQRPVVALSIGKSFRREGILKSMIFFKFSWPKFFHIFSATVSKFLNWMENARNWKVSEIDRKCGLSSEKLSEFRVKCCEKCDFIVKRCFFGLKTTEIGKLWTN